MLLIKSDSDLSGLDHQVDGVGNELIIGHNVVLDGVRLLIKGDNNRIELGRGCCLRKTSFSITGNEHAGNFVSRRSVFSVGPGSHLNETTVEARGERHQLKVGVGVWVLGGLKCYFRGAGCRIAIGDGTSVQTAVLSATEIATGIDIGEGCMFAHGIEIRTGDDHPILDEKLKRINPAKSVWLGQRVWLGTDVKVFKGVAIGADCVVGARSIVC